MSRKEYDGRGRNDVLKSRDKILTKMTRDGAVEQNVTAGEEKRISKRSANFNLSGDNNASIPYDTAFDIPSDIPSYALADDITTSSSTTQPSTNSQAQSGGSSQVETRLDGRGGDGKSGKQKSIRNHHRQAHSKNAGDTDRLQTSTSKGSGGNSELFAFPTRPQTNMYSFPSGSAVQLDYDDNAENSETISDKASGTRLKTSPTTEHQSKGKISPKSKSSVQLNEHRLSKVRQTSKSSKFVVTPPTDKADGRTIDGINTPHSKPSNSLRKKQSQKENQIPQTADEPLNSSKLRFAEDESPQEDIPSHQARSPTEDSTSLRNQQVRHRWRNVTLEHGASDSDNSSDRLDETQSKPPSDKATPPRSRQSKQSRQGQQSDSCGSANSDATDADTPKTNSKISKLEHRLEKTSKKLDKAKGKLPTKRKIRIERAFDEDKGKVCTRLRLDKEVKTQAEHLKGPLLLRPIKFGANAAIAKAYTKIFQVEHENVGTQAAHKVELAGEAVVRSALRHRKLAPYKRVAKLERKLTKRSIKLSYNRALEANPRLKRNPLARLWQKHKIKRQHIKAAKHAKNAAAGAKRATTLTAKL